MSDSGLSSTDLDALSQRVEHWREMPILGHGLYARYVDAQDLLADALALLGRLEAENTRLQAQNERQVSAIDELLTDLRRVGDEAATLRAALAPFAAETSYGGNRKCVGPWDTGYICGFDSEGAPIRGFTDFCRYCVAREVLDQ